jgi:hypothetical protein
MGDALLLMIDAVVIRLRGRSWPLCLTPGVLFFLADTPLLSGRPHSAPIRLLAVASYLWLTYSDPDDDRWKKLWGKIQSAGLTAVNAARFQQQVKEARS